MRSFISWKLMLWLIPLFLLGLSFHQIAVWIGIYQTYTYGKEIPAIIIEEDIKYIGAQTNGYVVIQYEDNNTMYTDKLSLPVVLLHRLKISRDIVIRYFPQSFQPTVIYNIYYLHVELLRSHILFLICSVFFSSFLILWLNNKGKNHFGHSVIFERIDKS